MGVFVKLAYAQGIPVLQIVAARSVVSLVLSLFDIKRKGIPVLGRRRGLLLARGLVGSLSLVCVYYSLVNLPFAVATVLQYLYPMFTALLAIYFLRERLHITTCFCLVSSFIGLLFIVRPEFIFGDLSGSYNPFVISIAVFGAFGSAIAYVLVRKLSVNEDPSVIVLYFPIITLPLSLLFLGDDIVMPQGGEWVVLLLVGIFSQLGQIARTKALQMETAIRVTSFSYLQVFFALLFGVIFFDENPTLWIALGATMILSASFFNVVSQKKIENFGPYYY